MRSLILALSCMLASLQASAAPVVYEYTGSVNTILEYEWLPGNVIADVSVDATDLTPARVALGDTFRGRFVYDPELVGDVVDVHKAYYGGWPEPSVTSLVQFDAGGWEYASLPVQPYQTVFNDYTFSDGRVGDELVVLPQSALNSNAAFLFSFDDDSGSVFSSSALPGAIDLNRFNRSTLVFSLYNDNHERGANAIGTLTSLTLVSAVPEPSTWMLALAGLAVIGAQARRRARLA